MLTQLDLEEWDANPEDFHHEQEQAQWQDKLRPCAEAFFMLLFEHCKEVPPSTLQMGATIRSPQQNSRTGRGGRTGSAMFSVPTRNRHPHRVYGLFPITMW